MPDADEASTADTKKNGAGSASDKPPPDAPKSNGKPTKRTPFPPTFYVANVMEVFERMAWYGFFAVSSVYLTDTVESGGLGFSQVQRGILQGVVPFLLYLFPVITGALADRYGYRRTFLVAFSILTPAYYLLGQFKTFPTFFVAFVLVAIGAATFKPVVVGTVGRVTDDSNRGLGFGVFYTIVNVGGFVGPIVAGYVRAVSWNTVFIMSATWIAVNFIPTIFFYKEPTSEAESEEKRSLGQVLGDAQDVLGNGRFALVVVPTLLLIMVAGGGWMSWTVSLGVAAGWIVINVLWNVALGGPDESAAGGGSAPPWYMQKARVGNWPFVLYLLILSGFWASFNQLFITLPVYIRDFVQTDDLVKAVSVFGDGAVSFLAHVNVDRLGEWIHQTAEAAAAAHTTFSVGPESHKLFYDLAGLKVRVPEPVIAQQLSQLAAHGAPSLEACKTLAQSWAEHYRQVNPEYLINIDAGAIVIFQVLVSWIIQRWKPFPVLVVGTIVAGLGLAVGAVAFTGYMVIVLIVVFAFGEMIASPKSQEYVARIAPGDKVALFMGYYFVSIALGNLFGGILSGWGYQKIARDMDNPELMWVLFGAIGLATAAALMVFNKTVVPKLEAQREALQRAG